MTSSHPGSLCRGLPSGCSVRRAKPGDAKHVADLLRGADRAEMEALEGRSAFDVLHGWMTSASRVLLMRGEAMAIYGIVPCSLSCSCSAAEAATPWMAMASTLGGDDLVDLLWLSRFQIDAWQRRWPRLLAVCDARNHFRRQWLDWLGFERMGRVDCFGAAGLPFDLHARLRDVAPASGVAGWAA